MVNKKRGMYKNLTSYGDNGFSIFLRKAFIKGLGYTDEMPAKHIIGIKTTFSDYNHSHGNVPFTSIDDKICSCHVNCAVKRGEGR